MTYLEILKKKNEIPNFWCSEEYFKFAGWEEVRVGDAIFVTDGEEIMLPPHTPRSPSFDTMDCNYIWADFPHTFYYNGTPEFLDYNYIYDPKNFADLSGKKWTAFRKNSRKWQNRNDDGHVARYSYAMTTEERLHYDSYLDGLIVKWLEARPDTEIQDHEVMFRFLHEGKNRVFFFFKGKLIGINVWDVNYKYINFRYCMSDPEEAFFNEFMRMHFYTMLYAVHADNRLVNDGGCLGSPELERFKDKLNPIQKHEIQTWREKK